MSVRTRRLAVAAIVAATMIAVPAAALASGSGPSGKPGPPAAASGSAAAIKAAARQSGALDSATSAMVTALATQLGVSRGAAQHAFAQIQALGRDGIDPASPAFAAIARDLGVSPTRLAAALPDAKQAASQAVGQNAAGN